MEKYSLYSAELLMLFNDDENLIREYLTYCDEHKNNSHQQLWKYRSYGKKVFMDRNYKTMLHEQLKLLKLTDKTYDSFKKH